MNEIRNFAIACISALGLMEYSNLRLVENMNEDMKMLLIKTTISLLAGILTTLITLWIKRYFPGNKRNSHHSKFKSKKK